MGAPLLSVARLAVNVLVGSVACDDRVKRLGAIAALEALPVPLATLSKNLLSRENDSSATGAAFSRWRLDRRRIDHGRTRSGVAKR